MSSPLPAELKPISAYLARATELAKAEPVMSYWCTYYAIQHAMALGVKEPASNEFLFGLMDKLEAMKAELSSHDTVTDDLAASSYIESFALRIFALADNEDRTGRATRLTAKKFLAAANFLELLTLFGSEQDTSVRDKVVYSKWKAAEIAKAIREGRTPVPGPAGGLQEEEKVVGAEDVSAVEGGEVSAADENELAREFAALEAKENEREQSNATSPAQDEPASYPFPVLPQEPTAPPAEEDNSTTPTLPEPDSEAHTPAFPTFLDTPKDIPGQAQSPATSDELQPSAPAPPPAPPSHQTAELPTPPPHLATAPPAFPAAVFPPAVPQPPTLPPPPPALTYAAAPPPPAPIAVSAPAPARAVRLDETSLPTSLDPSAITKVQKHAKWAISALNYDDLVTARKELKAALDMLNGVN